MPCLTLKIDVDTYRGSREGVPNLARLLERHHANATFLFSLGPDHTGWALRRAFRPGFLAKVARTSVIEHYGLKTLMYGVLLPSPDIGHSCKSEMLAIRHAGFECGIHAWDHVVWQDRVRCRGPAWTRGHMQNAWERYMQIFGEAPPTHGAAGWQMNEYAFAQLDAWGMRYASDGRCALSDAGTLLDSAAGPYRIKVDDSVQSCIQLPTTLPTLDELIGRHIGGTLVDALTVVPTLLKLTEAPRDHVFTLHAELEGHRFAPIFEKLLTGWKAQGYELVSMADYFRKLPPVSLPVYPLTWGQLPGRSGQLILQP